MTRRFQERGHDARIPIDADEAGRFSFRNLLAQQRGGILVVALALMALAVPLSTATLVFVSTLSKHSQIQMELFRTQYAGIGVKEYSIHKLVNDPGFPADVLDFGPVEEKITLNDKEHAITWESETQPTGSPGSEPIVFQTTKTVDPSTAPADTPTVVTYTIEVHNIEDEPKTVTRIRDSLPPGFAFEPGSTIIDGVFASDPYIQQYRHPQGSAVFDFLVWNVDVELGVGEHVTLEFQANFDVPTGNYCNEAWADPGGQSTGTGGGAAKVTVGSPASTKCGNELLDVRKSVSPNAVAAGVETTFTYVIEAENLDSQSLYLCFLYDDLPPDLSYENGSFGGNIPHQHVNTPVWQDDHWQFSVRFHPNCKSDTAVILPGETGVWSFESTGTLGFGANGDGIHQNVVRMDVTRGYEGPQYWAFSGPTADITVYNVFLVTVDDGTTKQVAEVWINANGEAIVGDWQPVDG